jgi:glycosyltransferase involved in cell wall biosynthesis
LVLYHGIFGPDRGIENLIAAMSRPDLNDAHLALLGFGVLLPMITRLVADSPARARIHVLDAVPPSELESWVAGADVEAIPIQRSTLNHYLSTPNKLFEALAVGVPVVVSDFPAMRSVVLDDPGGPLGATCRPEDPGSIAEVLGRLLRLPPEERAALRLRCAQASRSRWNWERESTALLELYGTLAEDIARK